eukprot:gb/GFBE01017479.1/.p1 GENE.gb/GFBE01017479.1/~~gb/GFBE01017479.1/.p1  ORF type:complete len:462 (+),score=98.25 gb/GFBE01017479.1/:1-1386(+)
MTAGAGYTSVLVPPAADDADDLEQLVKQAASIDAKELAADDGPPELDAKTGLPKVLKSFTVHADPKISVIPNFLSDAEIQHLLELSEEHWVPSTVGTGVYKTNDETKDLQNKQSKNRTSYSCMLRSRQTDVIEQIEHRLAHLAGLDVQFLERLNMVRYGPGQLFNRHHDGRFRPKTVFIYLNDLPDDDGGETFFPHLGVKFVPRKGCAVMWSNILAPGVDDERTIHQGLPPRTVTKYGVNCFFNEKPLRQLEAQSIPAQLPEGQGEKVVNINYQTIDPQQLLKEDSTQLRPEQIRAFSLHQDPKLRVVPSFLSQEEVEALTAAATPAENRPAVDPNCYGRIEQRISILAGLPLVQMEPLRVGKCLPDMVPDGQDIAPRDYAERFGSVVVFLFLNEVEGGELSFPSLGLQVRPCQGCAVVWSTVSSAGEILCHQGQPPRCGTRLTALGIFRDKPTSARLGEA